MTTLTKRLYRLTETAYLNGLAAGWANAHDCTPDSLIDGIKHAQALEADAPHELAEAVNSILGTFTAEPETESTR